jgi:hypothetical protein
LRLTGWPIEAELLYQVKKWSYKPYGRVLPKSLQNK